MLRLFKSNKNENKEKVNPEYLTLVTKWDAFLEKIKTRFKESLVNAEEAILDNLVESDMNMDSTLTALQGVKAQLRDFKEKIETTFEENVAPQMLEYIERVDLINQKRKGTLLKKHLEETITYFDIILKGKASQKIYDYGIKLFNETFRCSQCSAKVEVKKDIFRSHYVSCDYCNTINTFTPNTKIKQAGWVVDFIAKYKAIKELDNMDLAEKQYKQLGVYYGNEDVTQKKIALQKREETEREFWRKYFEERCALSPEYKETLEYDIEFKMQNFYEYRKRTYNF